MSRTNLFHHQRSGITDAPSDNAQAVLQNALLPCPFCNGEAERIEIDPPDPNHGGSVIQCKQCGASSPVHFDRKENLDSSWNQRVAPSVVAGVEKNKCCDCGAQLNEGEAATFTVCDACWDKAHSQDLGEPRGELPATHILQKNGIDLIAAERRRQLEVEGWTPEHDYNHSNGEMAEAAATYALIGKVTDKTLIRTVREIQVNSSRGIDGTYDFQEVMDDFELWPWGEEWLKPSAGDPIRNLVKAGALIAAEIDRLLRLKAREDISVSVDGGEHAGGASSENPSVSEPKESEEEKHD